MIRRVTGRVLAGASGAVDPEPRVGIPGLYRPLRRQRREDFCGTAVSSAISALLFPLRRDVPTTTVSPTSIVNDVLITGRFELRACAATRRSTCRCCASIFACVA